ncbi:peptide ABC transporter substrate-binding protein [Sporanaerobium hydrogeniformans]|uniref:peptide ABC transporter substrate-binding protein n=1 Tax=Sporanaerobium hydrogeniformans TaxID=3072179 RepID=UPI0015D4EDAA|nr:ABC transporter substrate-binding protein [Sporanaerobium hydrogeniformans]
MNEKKYKLLAILLSLCIGIMGCTSQEVGGSKTNEVTSPEIKEQGDEMKKQTVSEKDPLLKLSMQAPVSLNPLYTAQKSVQQILYLIFNPLVNIEEDGRISGNLASSWSINETNTALTLTLNQGLRWQDGEPLTSEDVLFTIHQIQSIQETPYKLAVENIASVEKVDDTTLKINYKQSFSGILQTLFFPIIPKHIYDVPDNNSLSITPIGSGPYKFVTLTPSKKLELEANPSYFKGRPSIQRIEVMIVPDEASSLHAYKQGLIDAIFTEVTEWGKYVKDKTSTSYEMLSNIYEFMGMNMKLLMFQNPNVRKALLYALDREKMINLYYLDHAVVTDTPIRPNSYLADKSLVPCDYDKEKAKFLFAQEGYEKDATTGLLSKNGIPFSFSLLVNIENEDRMKIAEEIKRQYKEIGIDMHIEAVDKETYLSKIETKQFDAFLGGWQLSYIEDLSFALHSSMITSGENYVSFNDTKMDEVLRQAFLATESSKIGIYSDLQKYFVEQTPYISLYFKKNVFITHKKIKGPVQPLPLQVFANIEKWMIE